MIDKDKRFIYPALPIFDSFSNDANDLAVKQIRLGKLLPLKISHLKNIA